MAKQRIAIIGGGITGLATAFYLQKECEQGNLDADYVLYEGSERLGGRIQTDYKDGFVIENGPDSFLARKQSMSQLAKEIGLDHELVNNRSGAFILHRNTLYPMPEGAVMGIPTKWMPLVKTKLFSPKGKARAACDLFIPRSKESGDQSLGQFFRKRLGDEVVDQLIEPLLSGIYAGNIDRLSLQATFPQFKQMENKYRSLIIGMKTQMASRQSGVSSSVQKKEAQPKGMFLTFRRGLQSFVDQIETKLAKEAVQKDKSLIKVDRRNNQYELTFADGSTDIVDRVILTTPHQHAYKLFKHESYMKKLGEIPATSVATVALAFPKEAVKKDIEGTGFVVSKESNYTITACTWTHKKWEHSAPEGYALLRAYVGKAGDDSIVNETDEVILEKVKQDLNDIMRIEGEPLFYRIKRWKESMPQYEVGHLEKLKQVRTELANDYPGIELIGASYNGIGLPDCIDQGKKVIEKLVKSKL